MGQIFITIVNYIKVQGVIANRQYEWLCKVLIMNRWLKLKYFNKSVCNKYKKWDNDSHLAKIQIYYYTIMWIILTIL